MSKRRASRYNDVSSLGRSRIVPFNPAEPPMERHCRRKQTNIQGADEFRAWCAHNGWTLEIKNDGHHWLIRKGEWWVEWWPSSAKLVVNKQWNRGVHCHDYVQVETFIARMETNKRKELGNE